MTFSNFWKINISDTKQHKTVACVLIKYINEGKWTENYDHAKKSGSGLTEVGKHLKANPTHTLDFDFRVRVLGKCDFTYKRRVIESLHLQEHRTDPKLLNEMGKSVPLFLFNVWV